MTKKLPTIIYGHWHNYTGRKDDEFFRTDEDPSSLVESGETIRVGVYELIHRADIVNSTTTSAAPATKRK